MRTIGSYTFYCKKRECVCTIMYVERNDAYHQSICRILSCSHQEACTETGASGEPVFPWSRCPACQEIASRMERHQHP